MRAVLVLVAVAACGAPSKAVQPPTHAGHYVIVFRNKLREGVDAAAYAKRGEEIYALASAMPGFVRSSDYTGEGGENVSVIEFDSAAHLIAWRDHPEHKKAQAEGREKFYASYEIQVCAVERTSKFDAKTGAWEKSPRTSPSSVPRTQPSD